MTKDEKIDFLLSEASKEDPFWFIDKCEEKWGEKPVTDNEYRLLQQEMIDLKLIEQRRPKDEVVFILPKGSNIANDRGWLKYIEQQKLKQVQGKEQNIRIGEVIIGDKIQDSSFRDFKTTTTIINNPPLIMPDTRIDKLINWTKNNRALSVVIFLGTCVIVFSTLVASIKDLRDNLFGTDGLFMSSEQRQSYLLAFRLGGDMVAVNYGLHHVTEGDSSEIEGIKSNAKEQLDIVQNKVEQLKLKINLKKLYETVDSKDNIFSDSKYDVVKKALQEVYPDNKTVSYFTIGKDLAILFIEGSGAFDDSVIAKYPYASKEFIKKYPERSSELNEDLRKINSKNRVPDDFTNIEDIKKSASLIMGQIEKKTNPLIWSEHQLVSIIFRASAFHEAHISGRDGKTAASERATPEKML